MNDIAVFSEEHTHAAVRKIVRRIRSRYQPTSCPKAILLAGQPGAGKTILSEVLKSEFQDNVIIINGDEYRRFHPNYRQLYREYGSESVSMTSAFSSAVTEALIGELSERRFHLIIEGTGRTVEVPRKTASLLSAKGYSVTIAAIAVRPVISLLSTILRFYKMSESGTLPRATAIAAHDKVVDVLPDNLDALNALPEISAIGIWTRDKEKIYDSAKSDTQPSSALRRYWSSPWSRQEKNDAFETLNRLHRLEERMRLGQGERIHEAERRLQAELRADARKKARSSPER